SQGDGEAAGRDFVRGARPRRQESQDRRRLRVAHARGDRQERGSVAIHPVKRGRSTQSSQSPQRLFLSVRFVFSVCSVVSALIVSSGCGKKGPPLPPLVKVPAPPADFVAVRRGSEVDVQFIVPGANSDGTRPANVERVDVY